MNSSCSPKILLFAPFGIISPKIFPHPFLELFLSPFWNYFFPLSGIISPKI